MRSFRFAGLQEAIQMRNWILKVVVVVLAFSAGLSAVAQQDVASIVGTVTDAAGGVIPGAEVTLLSTKTNEAHHSKTNSSGAYSFVQVAPGDGYKITVSASGFSTFEVTGLYLGVASVRTQDAQLHPGQQTVVEVNASNQQATIDTTDATVGNNLDTKLLDELPVYDRTSPAVLFTLQPGVTLGGSTTGARLDQGNVTIDGMDVNNFATGTPFFIVANAPVDSMQEFRATVAGELPSAGPAGGGQFQLVTKSGTNKYHGSISEYNRNTDLVANSWFGNNDGLTRAALIQNQFGGEIGGPIVKNRLFIYFNFLGNKIDQNALEQRTVPLASYLAGNVGYITNAAGCDSNSRANTTPNCIGYITNAQIQANPNYDPLGEGLNPTLFAEINQRYPAANNLSQGDGINTGGFDFTTPSPTSGTIYTGKLDYVATHNISLFARLTLTRQNGTQAGVDFPGDPVTSPNIDRSYSYAAGGTWVINSHMTDHFTYGKTEANYNFPTTYNPQGTNIIQSFGPITTPYTSPINAQHQIIPISLVSDDFTWQKGNHTFGMGGTFKWITSFFQDKLDYTTYQVGQGGFLSTLDPTSLPANVNDSTTAASDFGSALVFGLGAINTEASEYEFTAAGAPIPEGTGSIRNYRYYQYEAYAGDTWKVTPTLTITYGVNYQFYSVPYETHGFESVANMISADGTTSPLEASKYLADRIAQSNAGLSGNAALPLISYFPGGKANHQRGYYSPAYNNFAPRFAFAYNPSFDRKTTFNGSATMVYDRTLVDAVQFQQDQFNYLFQNTTSMPYGTAGASSVSNLAALPRIAAGVTPPSKGVTGFALPAPLPPQAIASPVEPNVSNGVPFGIQLGFPAIENEIMDPTIKTPYNFVFNFGMQHQFPAGFVMKLNYAGRLGRRLLAQEDVSQVLDFPDAASGQLFSQAFSTFTQQLRAGGPAAVTPEPWFENQIFPGATAALAANGEFGVNGFGQLGDIGDFSQQLQAAQLIAPNILMPAQFGLDTIYTNRGSSSYNGLLLTVQKNLSHGLQFDFNYTWSNSIDNVSLTGNQVAAGGYGFICDATRPRECRGPSDNDERQFISSNFIYALPIGRGRTFAANVPLWLDELIGGWGVSGLPYWHSGDPYTVFSNAFIAGFANDAPAILTGNKADLNAHPHKLADGAVFMYTNPTQAAADFEGPIGFNIGSRNAFRGPDYFNIDAELAKTFIIIPNKVNLKFAANAFNVLNHNSFSSLGDGASSDGTYNSGVFGQINSSQTTARILQVSGKISF